jgi:hypothetical protein
MERSSDRPADDRELREPPAGGQNREREGPGSGTEDEQPDVPGEDVSPEPPKPDEDEDRVDREAEETFPASDPPANY